MAAPPILPVVLALPRADDEDVPALLPLGGPTLLRRLLGPLEQATGHGPLVVTSPGALREVSRELGGRARALAADGGTRLRILAQALEHLGPGPADQIVLVHEAERALTPPATVRAVLDALDGAETDAAVPGIDVTDSVKRRGEHGLRNVDRSALRTLQCPRALRRGLLEEILAAQATDPTLPDDEIRAALHLGAAVRVVHGSHQGAPVVDRLGLWQAQIALGLARDTSPAPRRGA